MIKNIYYLIVGILSVLFSFTHALNGNNTLLRLIDASSIDLASKTTIFYTWHIITAENLIFGIIFISMAFFKRQSTTKIAAWLIAIIIFARWIVILVSTLLKNINDIGDILVDSIAIIVFITLIMLGIRKEGKIQSES